jgi:hypothetical protein
VVNEDSVRERVSVAAMWRRGVDHRAAPTAGIEPGYSIEVFSAVGETLTVVTLPESQIAALRKSPIGISLTRFGCRS